MSLRRLLICGVQSRLMSALMRCGGRRPSINATPFSSPTTASLLTLSPSSEDTTSSNASKWVSMWSRQLWQIASNACGNVHYFLSFHFIWWQVQYRNLQNTEPILYVKGESRVHYKVHYKILTLAATVARCLLCSRFVRNCNT